MRTMRVAGSHGLLLSIIHYVVLVFVVVIVGVLVMVHDNVPRW